MHRFQSTEDSYKHTLGDLLKTKEDSFLFKYDFQRTIGEARWGFYRK